MIDLNETILTFSQAAREIPGGRHRATIDHWATIGIRGGIRLEFEIIAGRKVTTREALVRFLDACREHHWKGIANGDVIERALAAKEKQRLAVPDPSTNFREARTHHNSKTSSPPKTAHHVPKSAGKPPQNLIRSTRPD